MLGKTYCVKSVKRFHRQSDFFKVVSLPNSRMELFRVTNKGSQISLRGAYMWLNRPWWLYISRPILAPVNQIYVFQCCINE